MIIIRSGRGANPLSKVTPRLSPRARIYDTINDPLNAKKHKIANNSSGSLMA